MGEPVKADAVSAWYGKRLAIRDMTMTIDPNKVTALIGPSGCGKSTFLRCINRMHEVIPGARVGGDIWVGDGKRLRRRRRSGQDSQPTSAWCFSGRTLSRPCRSTTTSPPAPA